MTSPPTMNANHTDEHSDEATLLQNTRGRQKTQDTAPRGLSPSERTARLPSESGIALKKLTLKA